MTFWKRSNPEPSPPDDEYPKPIRNYFEFFAGCGAGWVEPDAIDGGYVATIPTPDGSAMGQGETPNAAIDDAVAAADALSAALLVDNHVPHPMRFEMTVEHREVAELRATAERAVIDTLGGYAQFYDCDIELGEAKPDRIVIGVPRWVARAHVVATPKETR